MDGWGIQDNVYEGVGDGQQEVGLKNDFKLVLPRLCVNVQGGFLT